ncbi:MAG TPA: hypothetical protein VJU61_25285 [Polyangiaceae bacterium]|nr:hypothetical protein [Polyangiaceae bacterium]
MYVGRFIPAGLAGPELDENRAAKTACSQHFRSKLVNTSQEFDELVYVSSQAAGSLGIIAAAGAADVEGAHTSGKVLRVHYTLAKKLQVDSDPEALSACCEKNPGACTNQVVGEFLRGSGEIYEEAAEQNSASSSIGVPPVAMKASYSDTSQWRRVQAFHDIYFAFLPVATGTVNEAAAREAKADADRLEESCDFCRKLPEDPSGLFFCGVSAPSADEATGRDNAMSSARSQVVRYLGEQIETRSSSLSSSAQGLLKDERFVEAVAKGVARRVKDKRSCTEKQNSPDHLNVYKVLAFVPNEALVEVTAAAAESVAGSALSESDKAVLTASVAK